MLSVKYRFQEIKNGKMTQDTTITKKRRLYSFRKRDIASELILTVTYKPGLTNSGSFPNITQLKEALQQWTEPELLTFIEGGDWT